MTVTTILQVKECLEFVAAEGRYELQQDIFLDNVLSHPVIPTYVSSVSVKYKDYLNSASGKGPEGFLTALNIDRLDEQLEDLKVAEEKAVAVDDEDSPTGNNLSSSLSGNFHGNLVNLPLYNEESSGYKTPKNGMMSPVPQVVTPGPPPLRDSTSRRMSDSQYSNQQGNNTFSSKSLGRAASFSHNPTILQEEGSNINAYATIGPSSASSAGFSAFFGGKRKKPKNNIAKTNSTFVAKITTNENLSKILASRVNEDVYLFWNTGRTFSWSDLGQKPNEPLSHIAFSKAFPTAHDVNILTRNCDNLDVIIGFSTGDIIWFNPLSNKYSRETTGVKLGISCDEPILIQVYKSIIKDSQVTTIKWMPGSESQFMASFQDGTMVIMDKDRDDNTFTPLNPPHENSFFATKPKSGKHNPITHWNICRKPVTAFAFSPDLQHVAVVAQDGGLRIIDFRHERHIETFQSYFGSLNCVCWSPDGKYILTGGQDDLVTIWSFKDLRIVARCQGHQSYVTGVAFDSWRCDERNYRFGSVGEDAKLLLWDFSVSALHKPKAATMQMRESNGTVHGNGGFKPGHRSKGSITSLRGHGGHSLFSGHKPSLSQQIDLNEIKGSNIDPMQENISNEAISNTTSANARDVSSLKTPSISSSTKNSSLTLDVPNANNNSESTSISISGDASSLLSTVVSETGESSGNSGNSRNGDDDPLTLPITLTQAGNIAEEKSNGKKNESNPSKNLPPLQINNNSNPKNGEHGGLGLASIFYSHRQQQQQQQQQQALQQDPGEEPPMRPAEPRSRVAMLQPLVIAAIHNEPLASIAFREDSVMTSDRRGHIKVWKRPSAVPHHS
ncbi:hypothetical protein BGZ76_007983 [Entomortierella beljakovae]|nr:hypothetical protein BGZ76_007983 [Entomortierella beljakovae]